MRMNEKLTIKSFKWQCVIGHNGRNTWYWEADALLGSGKVERIHATNKGEDDLKWHLGAHWARFLPTFQPLREGEAHE
jgi:hypothetical protein